MRALIRGSEVYPENLWTEWTKNNLDREIEINGWILINDYNPPVEE